MYTHRTDEFLPISFRTSAWLRKRLKKPSAGSARLNNSISNSGRSIVSRHVTFLAHTRPLGGPRSSAHSPRTLRIAVHISRDLTGDATRRGGAPVVGHVTRHTHTHARTHARTTHARRTHARTRARARVHSVRGLSPKACVNAHGTRVTRRRACLTVRRDEQFARGHSHARNVTQLAVVSISRYRASMRAGRDATDQTERAHGMTRTERNVDGERAQRARLAKATTSCVLPSPWVVRGRRRPVSRGQPSRAEPSRDPPTIEGNHRWS